MFQTFVSHASPAQGPARLAALRAVMAAERLAGFIITRADAHQGEGVAARDERLQWLTGFTGSAGFCVVLPDRAGVLVDVGYRARGKSRSPCYQRWGSSCWRTALQCGAIQGAD